MSRVNQAKRRPSSADVAAASGVSRATVSYVLNDTPNHTIPAETRRRVLEAARELGYRPNAIARALKQGSTRVILLDLHGMAQSEPLNRYIAAWDAALAEHGYVLLVHHGLGSAEDLLRVASQTGAERVLTMRGFTPAETRAALDSGIDITHEIFRTSGVPNEVRLQLEHLKNRGHTDIALATTDRPDLQEVAHVRITSAHTFAEQLALKIHATQVFGIDREANRAALRDLLAQHPEVTALVAYNDDIALTVIAAAEQCGVRIPDTLAVIGIDDVPLGRLTRPSLTTVGFDLDETAKLEARTLIDGHPVATGTGSHLIVRESA